MEAEQLSLFTNNLPAKARSCTKFDVDNKVRYLHDALKYKYIQPNDFNSLTFMVFDIDRPTCLDEIRHDRLAPEPTIFVSNPANRHAHLYYLLKTPVHMNRHSSQKAQRLAAVTEIGLAQRLGADFSYVGLLAKNAIHPDWQVLPTIPSAWELSELGEYIDDSVFKTPLKQLPEYQTSRNCILFDSVSKWSYKAIRQGWPDYDRWYQAVLERVEMHNRQLKKPLSYAEYKHIAKSIAKWTHANFSKRSFTEWQAKQGAKGGKAKGVSYQEKRNNAVLMHHQGMSFEKIAKVIGCSPRSVSNWVKQHVGK